MTLAEQVAADMRERADTDPALPEKQRQALRGMAEIFCKLDDEALRGVMAKFQADAEGKTLSRAN